MQLDDFIEQGEQLARDWAGRQHPFLRDELLCNLGLEAEAAAARIWYRLIFNTATAWQANLNRALNLALGVRFLTLGAELLDDVVDNDFDQVRGGPTYLNTGAALLNLSHLVLLDGCQPVSVLKRLTLASLEAFAGQQHDLKLVQQPFETGEEAYLEQSRLKTGVPLAAVCLCAAEQTGKLTDTELNSLSEFGFNFGIFYQIKNDLAALQPAAKAKNDLSNRRISLPLIYLRDKVPAELYQTVLAQARSGDGAAPQKLSLVLHETGALDYAGLVGDLYLAKAVEALQTNPNGRRLAGLLFSDR